MTTIEIVQLFIGSGGLIGILFIVFRIGKFTQKLDGMQQDINEIKSDLKEVKRSITYMEVQIGKLETRVEERTLRVVKDVYIPEAAGR